MYENKASKIVLSGMSIALIVVSLYAGTIIINNKIFFLALATFIQAMPYARGGIAQGLMTYTASSIISFILIPNKLYAGVYALFGIYPLIKLLAERHGLVVEFAIKYFWFNGTLAIFYILFRNLINLNGFLTQSKGIIIVVIVLQIIFLIYDFIFTKFIMFSQDRLLR